MVLTLNQVDFQDLQTKVRINPETYLKFEDGELVTLQNRFSDKTIEIKYDIMLILYPMVNWITVGELCEGWPPEDQQKIKEHLDMLYQSRIVVTSEAELPQKTPSNLPENLGNAVRINVENHHVMLRDSIRMSCFQRAIQNAVTSESIVMDLGAGSGILSFFAARAGAQKIYAVEKRPDMVMVAKKLAKANGFEEQITFIENSSHLLQANEIESKPTVLVSEILGNAIFEENILEFTIDARDRFLAEGGKLIPGALEIMVVPFDSGEVVDKRLEIGELEKIYGFNFDILKTVLTQKPTLKLEDFNPKRYTMMGDPVCVTHLDFYKITSPLFQQSFEFTPMKDGFVDGFCVYFRAIMDEETVLTNSPWAPPTHWTQMVFYFPTKHPVKANEKVAMEMVYDGGITLWFKEDWSV